jgi:hypothetical protein
VLVPYFLLFLCSRKATQEIFSELDETKGEVPIFLTRDGVQSRDRGGPGARRTIGWRGPAPGRTTRWCGPLAHLLMPPCLLYILLGEENLKPRSISTKHTASRHRRRREIGRVQKLFPAPCQRGESPPEALFITMPASGVMCDYSTLDYGSIVVATWLSSPPCASCLDLVSCLS